MQRAFVASALAFFCGCRQSEQLVVRDSRLVESYVCDEYLGFYKRLCLHQVVSGDGVSYIVRQKEGNFVRKVSISLLGCQIQNIRADYYSSDNIVYGFHRSADSAIWSSINCSYVGDKLKLSGAVIFYLIPDDHLQNAIFDTLVIDAQKNRTVKSLDRWEGKYGNDILQSALP